jgi:uncharacterized protein
MSVAVNKQIVRTFDDAMARGDAEAALACLADDATWWVPADEPGGITRPKAEIALLLATFAGVFREAPQTERISLIAEDDRVALEKIARDGITPGGARYGNDYAMLFRLRDGKIIEVREYYDPRKVEPLVAELQNGSDQGTA